MTCSAFPNLRLVFIFLLAVAFISCDQEKTIEVCSPYTDKACITIMDIDNERRFIYYNLPDEYNTNYIELDISNIDKVIDGIFIKWNKSVSVHVSNPGAKIIDEKLSSHRYIYTKVLPLNGNGMPDVKTFHEHGYEVHMNTGSIYPEK